MPEEIHTIKIRPVTIDGVPQTEVTLDDQFIGRFRVAEKAREYVNSRFIGDGSVAKLKGTVRVMDMTRPRKGSEDVDGDED